jgi:hypothetical protein
VTDQGHDGAAQLPTPAGWYVEVPDEEGVGFSVRHAVFAPTYPVISKVFVDGQQACRCTHPCVCVCVRVRVRACAVKAD